MTPEKRELRDDAGVVVGEYAIGPLSKGDLHVLLAEARARHAARADAPPPPPPNRVMRGGRELTPHEIPPQPGQSRYRLAQRGPFYRVEEYRVYERSFWQRLRGHSQRMGWQDANVAALYLAIHGLRLCSADRAEVERTLNHLRQLEARDNAPSWQPVED